MRPIIYPAAEQLIRNKKQQKLDQEDNDNQEGNSSRNSSKRKSKFINICTRLYVSFKKLLLIINLSFRTSRKRYTGCIKRKKGCKII